MHTNIAHFADVACGLSARSVKISGKLRNYYLTIHEPIACGDIVGKSEVSSYKKYWLIKFTVILLGKIYWGIKKWPERPNTSLANC